MVRVAQSPSGAQIKDPRVFGLSRSKSPNDPNRDSSISPLPNPEMNQYGQEPKTPTALGMGFDFGQDMNNNVVDASQKVVYGLPNREVSVAVPPSMTNNYQQTQQFQQQQTRTVYTINQRHRFNSLTGAEHDWKEPLPIVNIPNTDQLLPSQTRQMQTYINQAPPTEKNLRPSLSGLERRRIRPVWPPPCAGRFRPGYNVEGRGKARVCVTSNARFTPIPTFPLSTPIVSFALLTLSLLPSTFSNYILLYSRLFSSSPLFFVSRTMDLQTRRILE